jgi:hypothetical protein
MGFLKKDEVLMKKTLSVAMCAILLSSCAAEKGVQLNETFWQQKQHKVAIVPVKPAKPGVTMVGSQGLVDLAINSAMTNQLDAQLRKTDLTWYHSLSNQIAAQLKQRHIPATVANTEMNLNNQRLASISAQHHTNEVLVMKLQAVGVIRRYTGFIPAGAPEAYCVLKGELIDTTTKQVKWRHLAEVKLPIQGKWDQPPTYPNVTSAVKEAIGTSQQEILDSFFSGH